MDRRHFLLVALPGLAVAPRRAAAQQDAKPVRVGAVSAGAGRTTPHWIAFEERLAQLGYVPGRNLVVEFRNADGKPERFPALMAELVRLGVDVILALGPEASLRASKAATGAIPIVVVAIDYDPIARGHVASLARPGGNITGTFLRQVELTAKRIELLKEIVPRLRHVAVFWDAFSVDQLDQASVSARHAGLLLHPVEFRDIPYRFDGPMQEAVRQRSAALLGLASPVFFRQRTDLARMAISYRLPAISPFREAAEAGFLLAYGASLPAMLRRGAEYVDRVFKGAKPADLPLEQPTQFELVMNLGAAKTLGLAIPPSLLVRADHVIE